MKEGDATIALGCWAGNGKLRAFYAKVGFDFHGEFPKEDYEVAVYRLHLKVKKWNSESVSVSSLNMLQVQSNLTPRIKACIVSRAPRNNQYSFLLKPSHMKHIWIFSNFLVRWWHEISRSLPIGYREWRECQRDICVARSWHRGFQYKHIWTRLRRSPPTRRAACSMCVSLTELSRRPDPGISTQACRSNFGRRNKI